MITQAQRQFAFLARMRAFVPMWHTALQLRRSKLRRMQHEMTRRPREFVAVEILWLHDAIAFYERKLAMYDKKINWGAR